MQCPSCNGKVTVTDVAHNTETNEIYRRRKCLVCGHKFYTLEFEAEHNKQFKKDWLKYHRNNKSRE